MKGHGRHTLACRARSNRGAVGSCRCYAPPNEEREGRAFLRGVLVALAEVANDDQQTLFERIVRIVGRDDLLTEARASGDKPAKRAFRRYGYSGRWSTQ